MNRFLKLKKTTFQRNIGRRMLEIELPPKQKNPGKIHGFSKKGQEDGWCNEEEYWCARFTVASPEETMRVKKKNNLKLDRRDSFSLAYTVFTYIYFYFFIFFLDQAVMCFLRPEYQYSLAWQTKLMASFTI